MNLRPFLFAFACICVGIALGIAAMQQAWFDWVYAHLPMLLAALVLITLVLGLAGVLGYFFFKWWIKHKLNIKGELTGEQVVVCLADRLTNRESIESPDAQERIHSLMVNLGLYYVRSVAMQRYFLVIGGVFTTLIGMATVFLLYEQNKKLEAQTDLLKIQNEQITFQTEQIKIQSQANTVASLLMEGTRRAALSSEQTQLFADIRAEATAIRQNDAGKAGRACAEPKPVETTNDRRSCWREVEMPDKSKIELVHLSDDLFQRVRAYALRATPYPIATKKIGNAIDIKTPLDEQFEFPDLSPERGQLLQTLVLNKVNVVGIPFESADLKGLDLRGAFLMEADLRVANLTGADLRWADLRDAGLTEADLRQADLTLTDLRGAYLMHAVLSGADFTFADLRDVHLINSNFKGVGLSWADLSDIGGLPLTNQGRRDALNIVIRPMLSLSSSLHRAKLPKGFTVSCSTTVEPAESGYSCPATGGWTITYTDQPEFADTPKQPAQ